MGAVSLTKPTECSVLLSSSPPWWPAPWQPSSPPPPLSPSKSARLRRPPAATSQFLMTELLLAMPIAQPPAQWPGPRRALSTLQRRWHSADGHQVQRSAAASCLWWWWCCSRTATSQATDLWGSLAGCEEICEACCEAKDG